MRRRWTILFVIALGLGVLGLVIGVFVDPRRFYFSYLTAWLYFVSIGMGAVLLVMTGHAARARWFGALRRVAEIPAATFPFFLLLVLPIFFGLDELYPWVHPSPELGEEALHVIDHRKSWLNIPFFVVRTLVWIGLFAIAAVVLVRGSIALDRAFDPARRQRLYRFSCGGLVILGFVLTWASFDWIMSLDPTWYSTILGVYFFAGGFSGALSLLAINSAVLRRAGALPEEGATERQTAVGRLLLAFVIFWAYQGFAQLLIIWIANLPAEVGFYQRRSGTAWGWVSFVLALAHFGIPFLLLLSRRLKRSPIALAAIAAWLLFAHYVDIYWLVMPNLTPSRIAPHWLDLAALLALFGALGLSALLLFRNRSLVAQTDPYFHQSLRYVSWP